MKRFANPIAMAKVFLICAIATVCLAQEAPSTHVPKELWGKWKVSRVLPTTTISCWGNEQARQIIGTEIEYTRDSLRWEKTIQKDLHITARTVGARQFMGENLGGGEHGNYVDFKQLGIHKEETLEVTLEGSVGELGANETPGALVLLKSPNKIVFSVCNVYFEAQRERLSHIQSNVPDAKDFDRILVRDLRSKFCHNDECKLNFELLRKGATQTGVAYPKFYVWIQVMDGSKQQKGAVRLAAIDKDHFEVTNYLSVEQIRRVPEQVSTIFPAALVKEIVGRAAK